MKDVEITKVIFRKFKEGDIIALFPDTTSESYTTLSYMHVGQHCDVPYNQTIKETKLATESEYQSLKGELEDIGYNLKVVMRLSKWLPITTDGYVRHS